MADVTHVVRGEPLRCEVCGELRRNRPLLECEDCGRLMCSSCICPVTGLCSTCCECWEIEHADDSVELAQEYLRQRGPRVFFLPYPLNGQPERTGAKP